MRVLPFFVFFCFSIIACKPSSTTDATTAKSPEAELKMLEDSVLAIHDELMMKMNDITHLATQLREIKSKVKETPEGNFESPEGLEEAIGSLKLAEQGMWDWMKYYSDTKATLTDDQLKSFYEKQLELILKIRQDILSGIEKAQTWIAANQYK